MGTVRLGFAFDVALFWRHPFGMRSMIENRKNQIYEYRYLPLYMRSQRPYFKEGMIEQKEQKPREEMRRIRAHVNRFVFEIREAAKRGSTDAPELPGTMISGDQEFTSVTSIFISIKTCTFCIIRMTNL